MYVLASQTHLTVRIWAIQSDIVWKSLEEPHEYMKQIQELF